MSILEGLRIIEFAGQGPGPFCGMMLADHGADVIRVEPLGARYDQFAILLRSRRSVAIDLKTAEGADLARRLCGGAHGIIEGFRPGVMERLGLGPDVLQADNPALVYGRMTGWGQEGPLAQAAGHDINYIARSGVLHTMGEPERPLQPLNYLGDFGGGGMLLAFGMVCGLLKAQRSGSGEVIDAAMVDGAALISAQTWHLLNAGRWSNQRGANILDGAAPFYGAYECADGTFIAFGSIEPKFYAQLRQVLGVADDPAFDNQMDREAWPALRGRIATIVRTRTQAEWSRAFEGFDACFAPVLTPAEAAQDPQNLARRTFVEVAGSTQPAPAPRFSQAAAQPPRAPSPPSADTDQILRELEASDDRITDLRRRRVIA